MDRVRCREGDDLPNVTLQHTRVCVCVKIFRQTQMNNGDSQWHTNEINIYFMKVCALAPQLFDVDFLIYFFSFFHSHNIASLLFRRLAFECVWAFIFSTMAFISCTLHASMPNEIHFHGRTLLDTTCTASCTNAHALKRRCHVQRGRLNLRKKGN